MNCLRCGRETQDGHAFCDSCLESMKAYPVRPGTAVILPHRTEASVIKKTRRHPAPSPKEQIRKLKHQRIGLWITVILLTLALGAAAAGFFLLSSDPAPKPGQNYVVVETTAAAE